MGHDGTVSDEPDSTDTHALENSGPGRPPRRWRFLTLLVLVSLLVAGLVVAAATIPVNKVIEAPGPTWNVLADSGTEGEGDLLTVTGTTTYPAEGALRMTTVSVLGCPGYPVTTFDLIRAWLDPDAVILDRDEVCPQSLTAEEINEVNQAQMTNSQDDAVIAALMESGAATSMTLTIESASAQELQSKVVQGDVLTSITPAGGETTTITTYAQLRALMETIDPGTEVVLGVTRQGQPLSITVTTQTPPAKDGRSGSILGINLSVKVDSEINATFSLSDVGGPSAGTMFALGIIDKITPGSLTGGQDIAGTGTITIDGTVGPIGGIVQKMAGARKDGSSYFLAPVDNCSEVVGHEPDGLEVFAIATLHDAVLAAQAIAEGDTSSLPTCQSTGG